MDALITAITGSEALSYLGVFIVLVACGLGLPLPEDVVLITGGYLSHLGAARLVPMLVSGFAGILAGDSIIFWAGRRFGSRLVAHRFIARLFSPQKQARVQEYFHRWGNLIVIVARFMPGLRAPTYFTCGGTGMPYWKFILFDGLAALASAPLWVLLGHYGGDSIDAVIETTRPLHWAIVTVVAVLVLAFVGWRRFAARRAAAEPAAVEPPPAP